MNIVWFKPLPSIQLYVGYGHIIIYIYIRIHMYIYIYTHCIYTYRYTYLIPRYPVFVGKFPVFFSVEAQSYSHHHGGNVRTCQAHADLLESSVVALREAIRIDPPCFMGKIHDFDWAIFHSFLYVHQRVYVSFYILYMMFFFLCVV